MTLARILAALSLLAACAPQPRSQSYFEGHPDEAARVLAACASGDHRGAECINALAADASAKRDARMKLYRRSF